MSQENQNQEPTLELTDSSESTQKIVPLSTKIKVVAALFVVGVSTYAAYWVQEPTQLRTDVVTDQSSEETSASGTTSTDSTNSSSESSTSATSTTSTSETSIGTTKEISMSNFSYDPLEVTVEKGTTVVWVNKDSVPHNVVGDNFTSGTLDPGQSFSFTFTEEGTFEYYCSFHPQMKGTVKVAAATSSTTQTLSDIEEETVTNSQTSTTSTTEDTSTQTQTELTSTTELHNAPDQSTQNSTATSNISDTVDENSENGDAELIAQTSGSSLDRPKSLEPEETQDKEETSDKIPDSGPEDFIYVAVLGAILYFNRKKILQTISVK